MRALPPAPYAIVGAGLSGQAARRLLLALGVPAASITLFDDKDGKGDFHDPANLLKDFAPRTLVVSPGYPLERPWIKAARAQGLQLSSEISLACGALEKEKIIGITGSLGKSTVTSLLGEGAKAMDPHAFAGGNLGTPLADYVADVLEKKRPRATWIALELSSYQLENAPGLQCVASGITYLSDNHLDRYPSREAYFDAKWNLARATRGPVFFNRNGGDAAAEAAKHAQEFTVHGVSAEQGPLTSADFARAQLLGAHNRDNLALAWAIGQDLGWSEAAKAAMLAYRGLPHRLENLGEHQGIRWINDSKATAMESVLSAVAAARENLPAGAALWLLLGGRDKQLPWKQLATLGAVKNLHCVFFGECRALAQHQSGLAGPSFATLKEAVPALHKMGVKKGDSVLLSPGGSSLDEFKNFEERGLRFAAWARE